MEPASAFPPQDTTNVENNVPATTEDHESSVSYDSSQKSSKKKKKHTKIKSRQSSVVSSVLEGLEEDVIEISHAVSMDSGEPQPTVLGHNISERLYVQNKKGFQPATRDIFQESFHDISENQKIETKRENLSPHEFAMYIYHKTRLFFSFCHGILGGFGLAHMCLVLSIADSPQAVQGFAEGYPHFARVVQIVYYILSAVCFVSVLDRCDFAGLHLVHCVDFLRHRMADIFTIIFYLGLLVATVVCVRWDDRLALSLHNEDLWKDPHVYNSEFMQWRILSILRGFLAVAGYIAMFFGPGDDLFFVHLYNMFKCEEMQNHSQRNKY